MTTPRGPTSLDELNIDWDYPVYAAETKSKGPSKSVQYDRALGLDEAFKAISKEDPRPLIVLRECLTCTGTDDALMTRAADNEKTMLMSRWFHCVKLPPAVLEEDHPFHNLFADKDPGHLFLAAADGSARVELSGEQSRTELWDHMESLLASEYEDSTQKSLKALLKVLDEYDRIDDEIRRLEKDLDDLIEKNGPKSGKVQKIQKKLTQLFAKKSDLRAKARKDSELEFRKKKVEVAAADKKA